MKLVRFTRDMAPHVNGESRVVPDDVAERLLKEGAIQDPPQPYPAAQRNPEPRKGAKGYNTRSSK